MIYIDDKGHVISGLSEDELHSFAFKIGLKREQFVRGRLPHYNCRSSEQAGYVMSMGAQFITTRDIIKKLRVIREKESKSKGT